MIRTSEHENGIVVVRPGAARLTAVNAPTFKSEVCALLDAGMSSIVVDFGEVAFLDSSGLGALVGVLKRAGMKGEVVVCGLDEALALSFRLTRMDRVFTIYPNAAAAVAKLGERM